MKSRLRSLSTLRTPLHFRDKAASSLEFADESAAKRVAEKIAYETGRAVTVRDGV